MKRKGDLVTIIVGIVGVAVIVGVYFWYPQMQDEAVVEQLRLETPTTSTSQASVEPTISIISPRWGDVWQIGSSYLIEWDITNPPEDANVEFIIFYLGNEPIQPYEEEAPHQSFIKIFDTTEVSGAEEWMVPRLVTPISNVWLPATESPELETRELDKGKYLLVGLSPEVGRDEVAITILGPNWVRAAFPPDYRHAVEIWHPDNWVFNCCGDKSTESNHVISSPDSSMRIVITDYVLVEGDLGEVRSVTPEEKVESLRWVLSKNAEELTRQTIKGLKTEALVYQFPGGGQEHPLYPGSDRGVQPSREIYLINTDNDVIAVTFEGYELFGEGFIDKFLNRLEPSLK